MTKTLGSTIRAWRERLPPDAAGFPAGHGRRLAGLRREELAELAGVSADYVVRLEQGRFRTPSAQVTGALARALQLSPAERDHLFRLARLAPPPDREIVDHLTPGVRRFLARLGDTAVAVFAADFRMIWWNDLWAALFGDPADTPAELRNFARNEFPVPGRTPVLAHWPVGSRNADATRLAIVSDLRRATGRFPHDERLAALVAELRAGNEEFARLWASGTVGRHVEDRKVVEHPVAGPITTDCDTLTDGEDELKIVMLTSPTGFRELAPRLKVGQQRADHVHEKADV